MTDLSLPTVDGALLTGIGNRDMRELDQARTDYLAAWYELNTALEYLNGVRPLAGSFDVIGLQLALTSNFGALCDLFGNSGFAKRANSLECFTAMSAAERWNRLRDTCFE